MFREALPVPVYSCWNGIIAMDARPFLGITPEGGNSTRVIFRGGDRQQHECRMCLLFVVVFFFFLLNYMRRCIDLSLCFGFNQLPRNVNLLRKTFGMLGTIDGW